jgi:transcriptional regulator with XRE-family HTH domain
VVGENLKRLRAQWHQTQDELADWLQGRGLPWSRSQVAAIETGKRESLDLVTAAVLAAALEAPLGDLLAGDGYVRHADGAVSRRWLRDALAGERVEVAELAPKAAFTVDAAIASSLRVHPEDIARAAGPLWNRSAIEERDRRVAELGELTDRQRQAHRGHVTRQLTKEIKAYLAAPPPAARRSPRKARARKA